MSLMIAAAIAVATVLAAAPQEAPFSALERAIAERACGVAVYSSMTQSDNDGSCVARRLETLRADFGRDLGGLTARERGSVDAACGRLNTAVSREAYLDCLNTQLSTVKATRKKASAAPGSAGRRGR